MCSLVQYVHASLQPYVCFYSTEWRSLQRAQIGNRRNSVLHSAREAQATPPCHSCPSLTRSRCTSRTLAPRLRQHVQGQLYSSSCARRATRPDVPQAGGCFFPACAAPTQGTGALSDIAVALNVAVALSPDVVASTADKEEGDILCRRVERLNVNCLVVITLDALHVSRARQRGVLRDIVVDKVVRPARSKRQCQGSDPGERSCYAL
jgi:hypothetical protein